MGALAQLLFGVAAIITALCTGVTGIVAVTRGSTRQRERAARGAIDRVRGKDADDDADRKKVVADLLRELMDEAEKGES